MLAFELTSVDEGLRRASASCVGSESLSHLFWLNAPFLPTQKKVLLPKGCLVKPWATWGREWNLLLDKDRQRGSWLAWGWQTWSSSASVQVSWKDLDTEVTEEICALMGFCRAPENQLVREVLGGQMYRLFVCLCFSAARKMLHASWMFSIFSLTAVFDLFICWVWVCRWVYVPW